MINYMDLFIALLIALFTSFLLTFPVRKIAIRWNIVDLPNYRKIHTEVTPRFGGIAIFIGSMLGLLYLYPKNEHMFAIILGALVIVITGTLDDRYDIRPSVKLTGQFIAASFLVSSGLIIEQITLPLIGQIDLGFVSVLVTVFWVIGITNAINLIDGLDGLAAGVSAIALFTIAVMAIFMDNVYVLSMSIILFWSILGFLPFNFFPAKVFMGDTGALFLGFMIAVLSLLGFKNVTMISFIIPILILAVPIFDTAVAIVRRVIQKRPISSPDSSHLHHRLVKLGMTHRQTVVFMYVLSGMFGVAAILLSMSTVWGAVLIGTISLIVIQILIETLELIDSKFKPLTKLVKRVRG